MFTVKTLITRTDVTCVKFYNKNILAGIGGKLHVFNENLTTQKAIELFKGQQIFAIVPNVLSELFVYGENQLRILNADYQVIASFTFDEWVLSAKWLNSGNIATVSMNNNVSLWTNTLTLLKNVKCKERCILYSAHLVRDTWDNLIVLSGTVFSQILVWRPNSDGLVLARLDGHKGVIFSIDYNQSNGVICSTSDDRSAMLWRPKCCNLLEELDRKEPEILLKSTLFCHTARVFRCMVLEDRVLTAGEDSLLVVWDLNGNVVRKTEVHQGASVWGLDYDKASNAVVTGGGDCGVTLLSLQQDVVQRELTVANGLVLKRTAIMSNGSIVCITDTGALLLYDWEQKDWLEMYQHDDLANYSLLEVSKCRNLLALAGYSGSMHIYALNGHIFTHALANKSRIFALHWVSSNQFLTCAAEGVLQLWLIGNDSMTQQAHYILPPSKERWTTTACICHDGCIAVGDRKGNIHIFTQGTVEPTQIIKKAHNYLGVTNLYFKNNVLVSLGRNSTVRTYEFVKAFAPLSTDKLPFSWLTSIYEEDDKQFLLAFLSEEFVVWDYKKRRILVQFDCGGGHRSWDFHKIGDQFQFVFIKDKRINVKQFNCEVLYTKDVVEGFHFNEINTVFCVPTLNSKTLMISGGEDTTVRLSTFGDNFTTNSVLKSHLSSVRTITGCKVNSDRYLIFSGGGRAQIILWELDIPLRKISEKYSYYEQLGSEESETRIMDLCAFLTPEGVVLIAATSSGILKVLVVKNGSDKLEVVGDVVYKLKCLLKLKHLRVNQRDLILSTATDGNVAFWDFTDLKCASIVKSIKVHASGINSLDCKLIGSDQCIIITGGDDAMINLNLISCGTHDGQLDIRVLYNFTDSETHCAQVTGTFLNDDYFVTTSIDQKLNISTWKIEGNVFVCSTKQIGYSNITDIQGMQTWKRDNFLYVIVYGKGVEIFQIDDKGR